MVVIWAVAAVVFLVIEGLTAGITSIWFAIGALGALVSSLFNAPLWLQILWFILISGVTLWLTRPLAKKYVNAKVQPTNADRVIGMEGMVTESIDNLASTGTVSVSGKFWTARSASGAPISAGTRVLARNIDGVKLIVEPIGEAGVTVEEN